MHTTVPVIDLAWLIVHRPDHDTLVECLPACGDAASPPRRESVTSGRHRLTTYLEGAETAPPPA